MKPTAELPQFYTADAFAAISKWECPEFKVSGAFSSHMVLQREKPIPHCVYRGVFVGYSGGDSTGR